MSDLTGQKFHRWTVIGKSSKTTDRAVMWDCQCACGGSGVISGSSLRSGRTKSCGCGVTLPLRRQLQYRKNVPVTLAPVKGLK